MDSKEVKSLLKAAREEIKNKKFSQSLKTCKTILKLDRGNYMALIFLGKSLQEVGPKDQAPQAFKKAIDLNSEQTLAWHGLASFYEKEDSDNKRELQNVYKKLISIETDQLKLNEIIEKFVKNTVYLQEIVEPVNILKELASKENTSDQNKRNIWLALLSLFTQIKEVPSDLLPVYETTLETILQESSSITNDHYKEYLKTLYKLKKYEKLFDGAIRMFNIYTKSTYALEWICKVYVELSVEEEELSTKLEPQVQIYYEKLLEIQPEAVMGLFVKAVLAYHENQISTATDLLKQVVELRASLVHAWVLLSQCLLHFCDYEEALNATTRADNILQVIKREKLNTILNKIQINVLSRHSDQNKNILAIERTDKKMNLDENLIESLTYAHINLGNFEKAKEFIQKLKNLNENKSVFLEAKLLHKQNRLKEAYSLLNDSEIETYEVHLEIGKLLWELKEHSKSLVPFLKAAKLNLDSFECFLCLGQYYEWIKDLEKARRCYQKAHKLNPRSAKAGIGLSNIYRQLKNWDANLALLHTITGGSTSLGARSESVRWAWLQLGLHHLHAREHDLAVESLRKLVRAEPDTAQYWECLADAYLARGSFVSAIRSFERAAELSNDNLYSKLQIANVKLKIGHLEDAKTEFEQILSTNKKYVPALKGLGETLLQLGITRNKEQRLGASQYFLQQALDNFTTALRERGDLSCLWKFTGDCYYVTAMLPEKYSCMVVHPCLTDSLEENGDFEIMGKDELFTLAARCYCKAISTCNSENIMLWQDLAVCYFSHGLMEKSLSVTRYCVQEDPQNYMNWNLLGAIYFRQNKLALAQHAFIKAVTLDQNSVFSWSNLGVLYHSLGDIKLANQAYARAQRADPSHSAAWTGQALIAAFLGHNYEAMDLFRHSSQLGYGDISAINYGSAVCQAISENPTAINSYEIKAMHAIPTAWDLLSWYIEHHDEDSCGWNILGILSEHLGLHRNALKAFEHAVSILKTGKNRDDALVNYGRRLIAQGRYENAINALNSISEANFSGGCGLALAHFKSGDYEQSYDTYEASMQWLAESEQVQGHVLVALAAMAYMFQGPDSAKTLLFQSTQMSPPSRYGLYATFSLGLLHSDYNLAKLVLKELEPIKNEPDVIYHCAFLDTYTYFLQGDKKQSIRCLSKYIHNHPGEASLWLEFAILLLQSEEKNLFKSTAKCAQLAMSLGQKTKMDITKVFCIVAYACLLSNDMKEAMRSAQKAVHCYPHVSEGWVTLLSILNQCREIKNKWNGKNVWLENILKFIKGRPLTDKIKIWLRTFTIL